MKTVLKFFLFVTAIVGAFSAAAQTYQPLTVVLTAGEKRELPYRGDYFYCFNCTNSSGTDRKFLVTTKNSQADPFTREGRQGFMMITKIFDGLVVQNPNSDTITIIAEVSTELRSIDNRFAVLGAPLPVAISGTVPVTANVTNSVTCNVTNRVFASVTNSVTCNVTNSVTCNVTNAGQQNMAASFPVVIASNQSAVPASQSGTWTVGLSAGSNRAGKFTVRNSADSADIDPLAESTFTGRINTQGQKAMSASTPVVIASDQSAVPASQSGTWTVGVNVVPAVGTQANAWSAATTGANGTSTAVDCQYASHVTVFGNTSGASTLTIQFSQDNSNFYDSEITISANGNFGKSFDCGARYVRIKSGTSVTATATIAAKN